MSLPSLRIEMFGGLRILRPGEAPIEMEPQQNGALLACLALHPARQHTREDLAARFWPEEDPTAARHNLRSTLHALRRDMEQPPFTPGSVIVATRTTVRLNPNGILTDVGEFESIVKAGAGDDLPAKRISYLAQALELYRGELLPGFYQEEFLSEQRRLADLFWNVLRLLRDAYEEVGENEKALDCARRAVTQDPLAEEAHCALMRLYARTGQPSAMLRQFQEMERILEEQLGQSPSLEACALLETLRGNGNQAATPRHRPVQAPAARLSDPELPVEASARPPSQADRPPPAAKRSRAWPRWAALAFALLLLNGAFLFLTRHTLPPTAAGKAGLSAGKPFAAPRQIREAWQFQYPRLSDERDSEFTAMAIGGDGNLYLTGFVQTEKHDVDFLTIKMDASGHLLKRKRYNGLGDDVDRARSIAIDADGNVFVSGESDNGKGNGATRLSGLNYVTIKYDRDLNQVWAKPYNGDDNGEDWARKVVVDTNGCAYVTGYSWIRKGRPGKSGFQCVTIKYTPTGEQAWVKSFSGSGGEDYAYDMAIDAENSVYLAGATRTVQAGSSNMDFLAVKYNSDGRRLWVAPRDGIGHGDDEAHCICVTGSGEPIVGGTAYDGDHNSGGLEKDYYMVRYSTDGHPIVEYPCNGPATGNDNLQAMTVDRAGNVYATGEVTTTGRGTDYGTFKMNALGYLRWMEPYNGPHGGWDCALAMTIDRAGNIIVTGKSFNGTSRANGTCYDIATIKYEPDGRTLWSSRFNGSASGDDIPSAIAADNAGNVYVAAHSFTKEKSSDMIVLKYAASP